MQEYKLPTSQGTGETKAQSGCCFSPNTEVGQTLDSGRLLSTGTKGFQGLLANVPSGNRLQWSELTLEGVIASRGFSKSLHFIPTQIPIKMLCSNKKKKSPEFQPVSVPLDISVHEVAYGGH